MCPYLKRRHNLAGTIHRRNQTSMDKCPRRLLTPLAIKREEGQKKEKVGGSLSQPPRTLHTRLHTSVTQTPIGSVKSPNAPRSKVPYHTPAREVRSASGEVCSTLVPQIGYLGSGTCKTTQSLHHSPGCNSVTRLHPELGLVGEVRDLPLTHTSAPPN